MFSSLVLSVIASVQPFCTKPMFNLLEQNAKGDNAFIAGVLYDEYLEEIRDIGVQQETLVSPVAFIETQRDKEIQADMLLDSFLESIAVLQNGPELRTAIQTVRRRALSHAREIQNPWKNTTWFDVATFKEPSAQLLQAIDSFLLQHADGDRLDRYAAKIAKLQGDQEACAEAERRTMERWALYNNIIEPIESVQLMSHSYPSLRDSDDGIGEMVNTFLLESDNIEQKKTIRTMYSLHTTMYEKLIKDLVSLIKRTRIDDGIDLLSDGCGVSGKAKNAVLQKTAEIHELNMTTIESIQKLLAGEEVQEQEG